MPLQSKQNIANEKRVSRSISQQQEEELKRFQQQQKNEYKFMKARLKRVSRLSVRHEVAPDALSVAGVRERR